MVNIKDKNGLIIHTSKNLRGLLEHFRRVEVKEYILVPNAFDYSGTLSICFVNGDYCVTNFASFVVMEIWCNRRRALKGKLR